MQKQQIRHIIFDLHGVLIYQKQNKFAHTDAGQLVRFLREKGIGLRFLTNSSSVDGRAMLNILSEINIEATEEEVFSAGLIMAEYVKQNFEHKKVYLIGKPGFRNIIQEACKAHIELVEDSSADLVVAANSSHIDKDTLSLVRKIGAKKVPLIATSNEAKIPVSSGVGDGPGKTISTLENAMGQPAVIVGKPNPFVLQVMYKNIPEHKENMLVVGDSVYHDIQLGKAIGAFTALIESDVTEAPPHNIKADYLLHSLDQIKEICES